MEKAIARGDIVWNGVPYTVESESMNLDLFETCLSLTRKLDKKYGKHTIAAKMTDVPGHTRSIIAPMNRAGIQFLHIGVNSACPVPDVPAFAVGVIRTVTNLSWPISRITGQKACSRMVRPRLP